MALEFTWLTKETGIWPSLIQLWGVHDPVSKGIIELQMEQISSSCPMIRTICIIYLVHWTPHSPARASLKSLIRCIFLLSPSVQKNPMSFFLKKIMGSLV